MWKDGDSGGGQNQWLLSLCKMGDGVLESNTFAVTVHPEPDPVLVEILQTLKQQTALVESILRQQQAQIADLAQKVSGLAGIGATRTGVGAYMPICFKCWLAGHIARQCRMGPPTWRATPASRMAGSQDVSAQVDEQQANSLPLWQ